MMGLNVEDAALMTFFGFDANGYFVRLIVDSFKIFNVCL
jgi:flagellar biosynthesis protein FliR